MSTLNDKPSADVLYTTEDLNAIRSQIRSRWILTAIPCILLAALLVFSLFIRLEWLTTACTIIGSVILISVHDLLIKPLSCYRRYLDNVLNGRTREAELPFVAISEDVNLVDGVNCRSMTCLDYDAKGRPYERLFYFDALKPFPDFKEGERLHITHHDLLVANVRRV